MLPRPRALNSIVVIVAAATLLAGCEKKKTATVGQVVARVGDVDITKAELDNELRIAGVQDAKSDAAKRVAKELVVRKYLAAKAVAGKLDQQPSFVLGMIRSHDQYLASAYTQREMVVHTAAINASEVGKFIDNHPDQFGKRVLLSVDQVAVPTGAVQPTVIDGAKSSASLDAAADYFTQRNVPFNRSKGTIDSAEVPEDFFEALKSRQDGHVLFVQTAGAALFFTVQGSAPKPLAGDAAAALARREITAKLLKDEMAKSASEAEAQVKYEGDLQVLMNGAHSASASSPTEAPAARTQ